MVSFTHVFTTAVLAASALALPHQPHSKLHRRSTANNTSKRGAAYNDNTLVSPLASTGTISWAYNWGSSSGDSLPSGVEYFPMLWGTNFLSDWTSNVNSALSAGSSSILGFNEPDNTAQANLGTLEAALLYKQYITPYGSQATLISPAVTSSNDDGEGLSWLKTFLTECVGCNITGMAVHWYGDSVDDFKSFIEEAESTASEFNLSELWVTEFALNADIGGISDFATTSSFISEVTSWMDSNTNVTRYSYFYCADNYLLTDGALNEAGQTYAS
ncbi:Glycoside hydrolase superfamily [Penicillium macrosclerotiorum]|uniref:Glycoside hydrolase superfamily n=1 Tax=Penicillium macrosclerotiorum TaxID=303699 RepID=UPI002547142F|nr:Glycoside hydrolase superfamily [Penicillium macrosclerotiorum]KAJ5678906.1 Glycoside hydrolase superfamily [Penicillium macrosclerotiorum]